MSTSAGRKHREATDVLLSFALTQLFVLSIIWLIKKNNQLAVLIRFLKPSSCIPIDLPYPCSCHTTLLGHFFKRLFNSVILTKMPLQHCALMVMTSQKSEVCSGGSCGAASLKDDLVGTIPIHVIIGYSSGAEPAI